MGTPLALKIVVILALMLQFVAIVYALRLVRRTKYSAIWILCVIGFVLIGVERYFEVIGIENDQVGLYISIVLGVVVSICISVAVLFAHRLVNYLDRVDRQRAMFNRRIMTEVLRAEERSKQHFSKELHDGMGPLLSSAKMSLSALSQDGLSEQQRELLSNTIYILDQALRSVREISNNLSPQVLVDFGLSQAVENFTSRLSVMHGVVIRFNTTLTTERFDGDVEVIVYRVICELINNSLKHSGCTDIVLDLEYQDNTLTLNYADNGCGFDPETVTDCGMGLSNISSRISSLGGTFTINSAKGMGFKATAQVQVNS